MPKLNFQSPESKKIRQTQKWLDDEFQRQYRRSKSMHDNEAGQVVEIVLGIIAAMTEKNKEIFELRFVRGLKNIQVITQLDYPESTFYRQKRLAIKEFIDLGGELELLDNKKTLAETSAR